MSFKQEVILGRHTLCQDQMLLNMWINPALLHGWLMFLLWKHWGLCEISEGQWYWNNDNLRAIEFGVNWVHVAIYAISKCNNTIYYFRKISKILLPLGNKTSTERRGNSPLMNLILLCMPQKKLEQGKAGTRHQLLCGMPSLCPVLYSLHSQTSFHSVA